MITDLVDQSPIPLDPADDEHRVALSETGFFGRQAAGSVPVARSTGRMLLMLRSDDVLQPRTHGNCGGAHMPEEDPQAAALRELREETGLSGPDEDIVMIPAFVFRSGEFVYRNFISLVPDEFEPIYGWEAIGHTWCTAADLPSPLHFGIDALLSDPFSLEILNGGWRRYVGTRP